MCGTPFTYIRGKKMTCSKECSRLRNIQTQRQYKATKKQETPKPKKKTPNNLNKDIKAARALGMSYGYYIAYMKGGVSDY